MIRAVVFDLFDTLVDLRWDRIPRTGHAGRELPAALRAMHDALAGRRGGLGFDAFLEALEACRRDFRDSHLRHDREVPTPVLMADLLARFELEDEALALELTRLHMQGIRSGVVTLDHHPEVLDALGRDFALGLCSNFTHSQTALAVLDQAALRGALRAEALVVSDAVGWRKPNAAIFRAASRALGVEAGEVLHVGDSLRADIAGAATAGSRTVWITRRIDDPERALAEHDGPAPDHVIADLSELPALCEALARDAPSRSASR